MSEQFDSIYFRGQGPLFIAGRDAAGNPTGLEFIGDISEASATPAIENEEINENVSGQGLLGATYRKATKFNLSLTMRSIKPAHLAKHLQGTSTAKTAASVTDEPHRAFGGKMIPLLHTNVDTVVVTSDPTGTTYAATTAYIVHAKEGLIEIVAGGAIDIAQQALTDPSVGLPLLIDYHYAAQHHVKVNPTQEYKYLVFSGMNSANNDKQTRCEIYKVKLDPGVLGLIQETGFGAPQITGQILVDTLRPAGDQMYSWKVED
jgi:hypothetical protein